MDFFVYLGMKNLLTLLLLQTVICVNVSGQCKPDTVPICLITVDPASNKNQIIWEKPITIDIDSFRIYRDMIGGFTHIASVSYSDLSTFIDTAQDINPGTNSYRYKLSVIDTCGNESDLSDYHETIGLVMQTAIPSVQFKWNQYIGFSFSTYRILRDDYGTNNWQVLDSVLSSDSLFNYEDPAFPSFNTRYMVEAVHPFGCTSSKKATFYHSSRSNIGKLAELVTGCPLPTAGFSYAASGLNVTFTNSSAVTGNTTYSWDFGDGSKSSTQQDPSYTYATSGTYNVCLTIADSCGSDSICQSVIVIDSSGCPSPTAGFSYSASGLDVTFANSSIVSGNATYSWDFGDGSGSSTQQAPSYTYALSGIYNVCLTIADSCGSDFICQNINTSVTSGLNEMATTDKQLLLITDMLGRTTYPTPNKLLFFIYSDGSVEKRIQFER